MRPEPDWLVREPFAETDLGTLLSGKEAQVELVERTGADGRSCLLARKRYLPRAVTSKGTLEALGVQRASTFQADSQYREERGFRHSRDRRAVERKSAYGRRIQHQQWAAHELAVLDRLWQAGAPVPFPVDHVDDVLLLEYVGDLDGAAPQLASARLRGDDLASAWRQLVDGLRLLTATGIVHADLSAFNLLWWHDRLWFIDLPQAVDLATNPSGLDLLHRDVANVCRWFARRGLARDPEAVFADLLPYAWG